MPLLVRYPALERIPIAALRGTTSATPVEHLDVIHPALWIKRDDLCADPLGGNKVRALEFLLGAVRRGDRVVTVGSAGSTHALAVAIYGERIGARVRVGRWRQEMNAAAERVARAVSRKAERAPIFRSVAGAYVWSWFQRLRGARWIAAGGSTPLGVLGHVNAGLELVDQIDRGEIAAPRFVVTPLGTGGTMAGLALAFAIAGRNIEVVGARVVPRIVARAAHVRSLANRTAALIERTTGEPVPRVSRNVTIAHETFGGAYGRETAAGRRAARRLLSAAPIVLDATYSAKAFGHAIELAARGPTLFWLTFDSRSLDAAP
jgi:D-cysteine desulfhydrase